jgi:hypothetical protein
MTMLLAADQLTLYPSGSQADGHGWALPDSTPVWQGIGNLQLDPGYSDARATESGGSGPYQPAHRPSGQLFLPTDAPLVDGVTVQVRGERYVCSLSRTVMDPTGGALSCQVATVSMVGGWPA